MMAGVRIALDARKLHDFGIGTYIRNIVRQLARLDRETEYGARGVPNVYITRAYMSTGIGDWNASHYKNPEFDSQAKSYLGALEVAGQRKATKRMAGILLRDTPVITDYFIKYTTASSSKVKNYVPEGLSHIRLAKVSLA